MKFILVVWVCTFTSNQCSPPVQSNTIYNSWNECVVEAYNYSTNFLAQQKTENVNEFRLATKFLCKEIENV
jgi:hypothetical protein